MCERKAERSLSISQGSIGHSESFEDGRSKRSELKVVLDVSESLFGLWLLSV